MMCTESTCSNRDEEGATELRQVRCFPVVNSAAARGLHAIERSESIALRNDLEALIASGGVRQLDTMPCVEAVCSNMGAHVGSDATTTAASGAPAIVMVGGQQPETTGNGTLLWQSADMGNRIQDEIHFRLDRQRVEVRTLPTACSDATTEPSPCRTESSTSNERKRSDRGPNFRSNIMSYSGTNNARSRLHACVKSSACGMLAHVWPCLRGICVGRHALKPRLTNCKLPSRS